MNSKDKHFFTEDDVLAREFHREAFSTQDSYCKFQGVCEFIIIHADLEK